MKAHRNTTIGTQGLVIVSFAIFVTGSALAGSDDSTGASSGDFFTNLGGSRPDVGGPLQGFYFGAGVGGINTNYASSVNDGSVTMIGGSDSGAAFSFFTGYSFSDYFAIEAGITKSDSVDYSAVSDGSGISWDAGMVGAEYDAEFITLAAVVRYPIAPRWWVIGKIGATWYNTTESYFLDGMSDGTQTDSGETYHAALGLEYDPGEEDRLIYRFEAGYQPVDGDDDLDIVGAAFSMRYEFP